MFLHARMSKKVYIAHGLQRCLPLRCGVTGAERRPSTVTRGCCAPPVLRTAAIAHVVSTCNLYCGIKEGLFGLANTFYANQSGETELNCYVNFERIVKSCLADSRNSCLFIYMLLALHTPHRRGSSK